jgi:hypothetical protein
VLFAFAYLLLRLVVRLFARSSYDLNSVRDTETRIGLVTRSFFEFARLLGLGGHHGGSGLAIERDTCFVNIVRGE